MADQPSRRARPLWRSRRLHAVLSLGLVGTLATGGSWASWSDQGKITGTTLTTGRLDLKVNNLDDDTAFTAMSLPAMYPGTTAAGSFTVKNVGTVPFTYTIAAAGTNGDGKNLVGALTAKIALGAVSGTTSYQQTCAGTAVNGSGTTFTGPLIGTGIKRTLAKDASETFCVQASLPSNAATTTQDATTALTFTVTGEQVQ